MTDATLRAVIIEAIRLEIVRQEVEEGHLWLSDSSRDPGEPIFEADGIFDLTMVADAVLALLPPQEPTDAEVERVIAGAKDAYQLLIEGKPNTAAEKLAWGLAALARPALSPTPKEPDHGNPDA